jgi:origin recognition complex subunit 3
LAGLLRPHEFADDPTTKPGHEADSRTIRDLPDTSILFKRYLDSSKMINVYDWFESFKSVLDDQRQEQRKGRAVATTQSPKKYGRGKGKAKAPPQPAQVESPVEEDEEKWNVQVQARFIRALHELDYLGFIKHSGRKTDHLMRTVFDIDDAE